MGLDLYLERRRLLRAAFPSPKPALFLDRDGVMIEDRHYLCDPGQIVFCPGVKELLKIAQQHGWPVVIITNQSGIARGFYDWLDYDRVTDELTKLLGETAALAGVYANGHGPDAPAESWRKPSPAMLLEAKQELNLDLQRSILIGDRRSDLEAGTRAGLKTLIHVLTGHGHEERPMITEWAQQEQESWSQSLKPEILFLDCLLDFPPELLNWNR